MTVTSKRASRVNHGSRRKMVILIILALTLALLATLGAVLYTKPHISKRLPLIGKHFVAAQQQVPQLQTKTSDGATYSLEVAMGSVRENLTAILLGFMLVVLLVGVALTVYYLTCQEEVLPSEQDDPVEKAEEYDFFSLHMNELIFGMMVLLILVGVLLFASGRFFKGKPVPPVQSQIQEPVQAPVQTPVVSSGQAPVDSTSQAPVDSTSQASVGSNVQVSQTFCDKSTPVESGNFVIGTIGKPIDPVNSVATKAMPAVRDRFIGAMVGLALCDAYGSAYEFKTPEEVKLLGPTDDHKHVGHFSHRLGAWTDDTSMALCLLASACERGKFDTEDVFNKYKAWYNSGYMNFDGVETDFGSTTEIALKDNHIDLIQPSWGNGVIMRLAPVVMQYLFSEDRLALRVAAASGAMTSGDKGALDFTATLAFIMRGFIMGTLTKAEVCQKNFVADKLGWYFAEFPHGLHFKKVLATWPNPVTPAIKAEEFSSQVVFSRALWSFCETDSFIDGLKQVVSYGKDADTAAAVYGQIYGSYAGMQNSAELKRNDGVSLVDGVEDSKLYYSTQRSDAITLLSELLWAKLTGDFVREELLKAILLLNGKVRDFNPKYHFTKVVKDVFNGKINLSTEPHK